MTEESPTLAGPPAPQAVRSRPEASCAEPAWREEDRRAALERYAILDTGREAAFDEVAELAADLLDAPMAVVNLIASDRQWFKAELGIGTDSLPLDVSICRHAILQPGVMVVPDLQDDPRFEGNPLIHVAGGLRFYAGALLETPEGLPLGTVCVLDREPRPEGITERQRRALAMLASQAMAQIELRRAKEEAQATARRQGFLLRLDGALRAAATPDAAKAAAAELLGRELGAGRVTYMEVDEETSETRVAHEYLAHGMPPSVGTYRLAELGPVFEAYRTGEPLVVEEHRTDPRTASLARRPEFAATGVRSVLDVPLLLAGRIVGVLVVNDARPRRWTAEEVELARAVAERTRAAVERSAAESALRESEARYRSLFESIDEGFCVVEFIDGPHGPLSDYVHVEANPAYLRHAGIPDIVGQTGRDALTPEEAEGWVEIFRRVLLTGESTRFERELVATARHLEVAVFPVRESSGRQLGIIFQDVTARRRAETALRELNETLESRVAERTAEREQLARIVETTGTLIQALDRELRWIAVNRATSDVLHRLYGRRPRLGQSLPEFFAGLPEHLAEARVPWDRALAGEALKIMAPFGDPGHERRTFELTYEVLRDPEGRVTGALMTGFDVTERLRDQARLAEAEEQLRQAQKMDAMGQLTGGVAHDFNNLLTPIVAVLDRLQRQGFGGEREQRLIVGAAQSAERARTLVQRLLAFARRQPLQAVPVDVVDLVRGMADLVASTTGPQVRVAVEVADDLPPAKADPNQLEMALLNLAVNARDAMPDGGTLRISATAEAIGAPAGRKPAPGRVPRLAPGRYVRLSVADTGVGMDEATLARAVEPFFSTKGVGKGTGLGLSMVHGLASQLGGALEIQSRPGLGTNVELWLPQSREAPEALNPPPASAPDGPRGTALLVDDEEAVRLSTADMLAELGFHVLEAASAEEALAAMRDGAQVDLVVTDHLMPGMTGSHLAREVRALRPGLPILVVSGYAESEGLAPDLPRLAKPFRKDELAASLAGLATGRTGQGLG